MKAKIAAIFFASIMGICTGQMRAEESNAPAFLSECVTALEQAAASRGSAPAISDCSSRLASLLMMLAPDQEAGARIRKALQGLPDDIRSADVLEALAFDSLRSGDSSKASEYYLRIILRFPASPNIQRCRLALARSFRLQKDYKQARMHLESLAGANDAIGPWADLELARLFHDQGDDKSALAKYKRLSMSSDDLSLAGIAAKEMEKLNMSKLLPKEPAQ
jgi:tetratricopeptide (TPR) repeat protein